MFFTQVNKYLSEHSLIVEKPRLQGGSFKAYIEEGRYLKGLLRVFRKAFKAFAMVREALWYVHHALYVFMEGEFWILFIY